MTTRARIIELHESGLANAEIARIIGVTRQRVSHVLRPEETDNGYSISVSVSAASQEAQPSLLTIGGVAAILEVHPNTIRRWSDEGLIPCFRLGPRQDRRFDPQLVLEAIGKGTP